MTVAARPELPSTARASIAPPSTAPPPTARPSTSDSADERTAVRSTRPAGGAPLGRWVVGVGLLVAVWCALGIPAEATYFNRTTADEPQYLLSALSLWEDRDLDISDEIAARDYESFHSTRLSRQTEPFEDGREISPHDPLLPVLLAVPVGLAGWAGAKAFLAVLAGVLAGALVWLAVRRFEVPTVVAAVTVAGFGVAAPLAAYGTQVYPELPAALAVTVAVGALTGPMRRLGPVVVLGSAVALAWLGVKYLPVAAALGVVALVPLVRARRWRTLAALATAAAAAGVVYLVGHRLLYGGWTVYAAGDHFVDGEAGVIGFEPDYWGRSRRLVGLLVDRGFGLAAWAPLYLLAVPALAALVRLRPRGWAALVVPLVVGWLVATFVALTMHGFWWPGRQVVVVLPLVVLAVAWWVGRVVTERVGRVASERPARWWPVALVVAGGLLSAVLWGWVVVEVLLGHRRLIIDFESTANPLYRVWRSVLPEGRDTSLGSQARSAAWVVVLAGLAVLGWRTAPRTPVTSTPIPTTPIPTKQTPNEQTPNEQGAPHP